jgi:hypothetical protein
MEGNGAFLLDDGGRIEFIAKDGRFHTKGVFELPDGSAFEGWFQEKGGILYSEGRVTFTDGARYEGKMKQGKFHGRGTYVLPNGEKLQGEWKDGVAEGNGIQTLPDGTEYVGSFKAGLRQGQGTLIFLKRCDTWANSKIISLTVKAP